MNTEILKDKRALDNVVNHISFFKKEHWYLVKSSSLILNGTQAKVWCLDNVFYFEIAIVNLFSQLQIEQLMNDHSLLVKFENRRYNLNADYKSISSFSFNMALGQGYVTINGTFQKIISSEHPLEQNSKFTALIKCRKDNFLGSYFSAKNLKIGDVTYSSRLIELTINEIQLHLYLYKDIDVEKQLLFIECLEETEYDKFIKVVHETILSLAYITGAFIGKEIFIFNDIFTEISPPIIVSWFLYTEDLKSTQFGVIPKINDGISEHSLLQHKYGLLTLETIIGNCIISPSYRRTILLMIHANTQPDYIQVVLYAVALESITELIYKDNKSEMKPISDKKLVGEIRLKLIATLQEFSTQIGQVVLKKFSETINNINKPTNGEKLTKPFTMYNIPLASSDSEAINNRNDLLHGRLSHDAGSHELAIISYRLQYCVNSLMMKFSGFTGAIIYQASIYQNAKKIKMDSPAYRMI